MHPQLLCLIYMAEHHRDLLQQHFDLVYAPEPADWPQAFAEHGATVRAVLTNGAVGLTAAQIDALPKLEFVSALGVGFENIDIQHARQRGVALANGAGTNDDCVADHAMMLLLAAIRNLRSLDQQCRAGVWRNAVPMPPNVSGRKLGIIGLGGIGRKLARRAQAFDIEIGYHGRNRQDVPYQYFGDAVSLAQWADYLVVATPGGAATRHMVNPEVLRALGSRGVLVNIARGSVVDTAALAQALREGWIHGAGLDVYESEPKPPEELLGFDNLVLTPHLGGWSHEAMQASVVRFIDNAECYFTGKPLITPI